MKIIAAVSAGMLAVSGAAIYVGVRLHPSNSFGTAALLFAISFTSLIYATLSVLERKDK